MRRLFAVVLMAGATLAQAQAPGTMAASPAKKELVQKILHQQQANLEAMARGLVEQPAALMMQEAGRALQTKVPADKREVAAKTIDADVKKYVDDAYPLVRDRALKAAPLTLGAALEDKFTEEELKQLSAWFDSPVNKKYQQLSGDMQRGFVQKVVADSRPLIEPKIQALEQKIRATLGLPPPPAGPASGPARASSP